MSLMEIRQLMQNVFENTTFNTIILDVLEISQNLYVLL